MVGITPSVREVAGGGVRWEVSSRYAEAVVRAGGRPVVLGPMVEAIAGQLELCDAFILTGGDDPMTEQFGWPTHPEATPIHPQRQAYELALLDALADRPDVPVLGVCLGMQLMALHAGGELDQFMPETTPTWRDHYKPEGGDCAHAIRRCVDSALLPAEAVVSSRHRQAVREAGSMRVLAVAHDGVIEAIDWPSRACYFGVQWHPERTARDTVITQIFGVFVGKARDVRVAH